MAPEETASMRAWKLEPLPEAKTRILQGSDILVCVCVW